MPKETKTMSDETTKPSPAPSAKAAAAAAPLEPKIDRVALRTRVASHCFPLRVQQANGLPEAKREYAAIESVKDADALLKALGY